jgi:hypothetical protein
MTKTNLSSLIDAFGVLKAKLAELEGEEKDLKKALADLEPGAYEGELYRLTISLTEREVRDEEFKDAIAALIEEHFSRQYVKAHTSVSTSRVHRVGGRNGKRLAE